MLGYRIMKIDMETNEILVFEMAIRLAIQRHDMELLRAAFLVLLQRFPLALETSVTLH